MNEGREGEERQRKEDASNSVGDPKFKLVLLQCTIDDVTKSEKLTINKTRKLPLEYAITNDSDVYD